jgi:hypothetical protein
MAHARTTCPVCSPAVVYEVRIAPDQKFPRGEWCRVLYLDMARSIVARLASEGVKATINACTEVK